MNRVLGILGLLAAAAPGWGQGLDFTLRVDVPAVSFDVSVLDDQGRPVTGLRMEDFEILENDIPQPIAYFGSSQAPFNVYLLFDISGSTANKWEFMRKAVETFSQTVGEDDRISVGVFGSYLSTLTGWGDSRRDMLAALNPRRHRISAGRATQLYQALHEVLQTGFHGVVERRAVIVLTDGRDASLYHEIIRRNGLPPAGSAMWYNGLYPAAAAAGIPIYFLAVNTDLNLEYNTDGADEFRHLQELYRGTDLPLQYLREVRARMEDLAEVTGGATMYPRSLHDVAPLFEEVARTLSASYSVGYVPAPAAPGEKVRQIRVRALDEAYTVRQGQTEYFPR